jgi:hypothetical protein
MIRSRLAHAIPWTPLVVVLLGTGCASQTPYVSRAGETARRLELVPSAHHHFEYVRIDDLAGLLTVYGKVRHSAAHCAREAHVDMTITPPGVQKASTVALPLRNAGQRRRGWAGAAFRVRQQGDLPAGTVIRLAFHEASCTSDGTWFAGKPTPSTAVPPTVPAVRCSRAPLRMTDRIAAADQRSQ